MKDSLIKITENFIWNIATALKTITIRRDNSVWLFGAWMGERFADNSRYLFQYLSENKNRYGIRKVIWVSRSPLVVELVKSMGYQAFLIDSCDGHYFHYKAGVHIVCNSMQTDLDCKRSFGAIKIQLWHGNGIKASGRLVRKHKTTLKERVWDAVISPLRIPGGWSRAYWLACSRESARVLTTDSGASADRIIIANSPRLCKCPKYTNREQEVIERLKKQRAEGGKTVLFLPTFRASDSENYIAPLSISGFEEFLDQQNILWIQKNHFADQIDRVNEMSAEHILSLENEFDVNVLYDYIDLFISDYSSATTDAIYKDVVTVDYCPDYNMFAKDDRGFVSEYDNYHIGNFVDEPSKLPDMIQTCLEKTVDDFPRHRVVKNFLFDDNKADYDTIIKAILAGVGLKLPLNR